MKVQLFFSCLMMVVCTTIYAQPKEVEKITVEIPAQSNVYFHEIPDTSKVRGGAGIPPVAIDVRGVKMISFENAEGLVSCFGEYDSTYFGADGGAFGKKTDIADCGSYSGIKHDKKVMFLTGVMISDYSGLELPLPADDFTNTENKLESFPAFGQTFFIGDGKTADGATQRWLVSKDATTLYLGFADCLSGPPSNYRNNAGTIKITVILYRSDMGRN